MIRFGDWVRINRLALGWGQVELARNLGKKQSWITRLETGRTIPNVNEVEAIGRALGDVEGAFKAAREKPTLTVQDELETFYHRRPLNEDELKLLEVYRQLQPRDKRRAATILSALSQHSDDPAE